LTITINEHSKFTIGSIFKITDIKTKRNLFKVHTGRMSLSDDVDLEVFVMSKDNFTGIYICICTLKYLYMYVYMNIRIYE
jgi:hypothetical protein